MIKLDGQGTLTRQLIRSLRHAVAQQRFTAGERLPSTRQLAKELGISRNVVIAAYDQLSAEGYLETRVKSGTFVSAQIIQSAVSAVASRKPRLLRASAPPLNETAHRIMDAGRKARQLALKPATVKINFEYGLASTDDRTALEWRRLHRSLMRDHSMNYGDPAGHVELRQTIARHLVKYRGLQVDREQIVVTSGSQQALDLVARLMIEPGDTACVEEPGYQGAVQAFVAAGAKIHFASIDAEGLIVDRLRASVSQPKIAYLTPSHQFPTGVVMPVSRRLEMLEWARVNACYLIEDDYDSEFRYDCAPIESIAAIAGLDPVIYLGTFAKSLYPALRIGYLVLPESLIEAFTAAKWLCDRGNPTLPQRVLAQFMRSGAYQRHLSRSNRRYAKQRLSLVTNLHNEFGDQIEIAGADAGTHLVCWFNQLTAGQLAQLIATCRRASVAVYPIDHYYCSSKPDRAGLLLGFAALTCAQIEEGIAELGTAFRAIHNSPPAIRSF